MQNGYSSQIVFYHILSNFLWVGRAYWKGQLGKNKNRDGFDCMRMILAMTVWSNFGDD